MFEAAIQHVIDTIAADPVLGTLTTVRSPAADFDDQVANQLRTTGLCLTIVAMAGINENPDELRVKIRNEIVVGVLENPATNQTGHTILEIVEAVIRAVHQSKVETEKGIRNTVTSDQPAYEIADLDEGPQAYLVNFKFKTII